MNPLVGTDSHRRSRSDEHGSGASGSALGRLSRVDVGGRALHIQTETAGPAATRIETVVVVEGRVRQRVTTEAPTDATKRLLEELISEQHDRVEEDLRHKLCSFEVVREQELAVRPASSTRAAVLTELRRRVTAEDYCGAIALLERALEGRPGDWLWETHLSVVRRKLQR